MKWRSKKKGGKTIRFPIGKRKSGKSGAKSQHKTAIRPAKVPSSIAKAKTQKVAYGSHYYDDGYGYIQDFDYVIPEEEGNVRVDGFAREDMSKHMDKIWDEAKARGIYESLKKYNQEETLSDREEEKLLDEGEDLIGDLKFLDAVYSTIVYLEDVPWDVVLQQPDVSIMEEKVK